jgi:hypothetical protein
VKAQKEKGPSKLEEHTSSHFCFLKENENEKGKQTSTKFDPD